MPGAKVQADVVSFNAAISACEKGGQWQRALALFGAMPEASAQANEVSFNASIRASAQSRLAVVVKTVLGSHLGDLGVGEFTTHFGTHF